MNNLHTPYILWDCSHIGEDGIEVVPIFLNAEKFDHFTLRNGLHLAYIKVNSIPKEGIEATLYNNPFNYLELHNTKGSALINMFGDYIGELSDYFKCFKKSHKKRICYQKYFLDNKLSRFECPAIITLNTLEWYINNQLHRFNGPALMRKSGFDKVVKSWSFLNKDIPLNIITFENSIPSKELNQTTILEAMLFDRAYGATLKLIYDTQNIPSEKDIYNFLLTKGCHEKSI